MAGEDKQSVIFTRPEGETKPPLEGVAEEAAAPEEEAAATPAAGKALKMGKVPLHPAVIRIPFSIIGRVGTELTGYAGFTFTDRELKDLTDLWAQVPVEVDPRIQALIGTTAMVGGKALGYVAWTKAGKPPIEMAADGQYIMKPKKEEPVLPVKKPEEEKKT